MIELMREGGFFFWVLMLCSILSIGLILERAWALRRGQILPSDLVAAVSQPAQEGVVEWVRSVSEGRPSPLGRLLVTAIDHLGWPKSENESALQVRARQEVVSMERGLVLLEIITGIAPLLGLVGTIYGIIPLFGDFGKMSDNALLAKGIGAALNKTLVGLMVAIPSLVAWSYFNKKVENLAVELEANCDLFLRRQYGSVMAAGEGGGGQAG